jgi:hypothetical protein
MRNVTRALASVTSGLVVGLMYFLSPMYGNSNYNKAPEKVIYSLSEEQIEHQATENKFTWQWNLDPSINPEPKFEDYLMPISLCNKVTDTNKTSGQVYGKTSSKTLINGQIARAIKDATDYSRVPIQPAWNPIKTVPSCNIDPQHKVVQALIEAKAQASDDNYDLGPESIFRKDKPNLETAQSRDIKIAKALEGLNSYNSDVVKIVKLPPEEVQFRQDYINQLLEKQYPMGTKLERLEILSKINQSDRRVIKDGNLENLISQNRGLSISTTKMVETQHVLTIPAPVGLTPMLLLVPSVRIASFQTVRVVFTTGLFTFNRLTYLGLHLLRQFAQLSLYSLRLLRIALKKLLRVAKKGTINAGIWAIESYQDSLDNLAAQFRQTRVHSYLLNRKTRSIQHFSDSRLSEIYGNSITVMSITNDLASNGENFSIPFAKSITLHLLDKSVSLAEEVHKELIGLMLAQYVNTQVNINSIDEAVKSFLVAASWHYHDTSRIWINQSKNTIYSIIRFQTQFNELIGVATQALIRATLHALIGLVEALEIVLNKFRKNSHNKTAITYDISTELNADNITSVMMKKIMEDLDSGQKEQMYQFQHNDQFIVLHVNYHPNENLLVYDEPSDEGMLSFSTDKFTVRAKILD